MIQSAKVKKEMSTKYPRQDQRLGMKSRGTKNTLPEFMIMEPRDQCLKCKHNHPQKCLRWNMRCINGKDQKNRWIAIQYRWLGKFLYCGSFERRI